MSVLPVVDDRDTGGFFQAAAEGRLTVRRCTGCDAVLHMPVSYCRHCGSTEGRWDEVAPTGRVYSYTVVTHQVHPDFAVPYTVVLIELDDVPEARLVGRIDGRADVHIGLRLVAELGGPVPTWRPRAEPT
jgi:uncharacterized OB-fold protein